MYRDGGTIEIETDKGIYCYDNRIMTKTKGCLYENYPKDDNSNLISNSHELEKEIIEALKNYKNDFYRSQINDFINNKR